MRKLSLLVVAAGFFLLLPTPARADFTVAYPDGAVALAMNVGPGLYVVATINDAPDPDIYTIHTDASSNPVLIAPVNGFPTSGAMWLNFLGLTPTGRPIYAIYGT